MVYGIRDAPASPCCLVLLHGFASSGRLFDAAWDAAALAGYALLVPDLPGFGASPPAATSKVFEAGRALLAELLAPRKQKLVFVGAGSGGSFGLELARELPQAAGWVGLDMPLRPWDAEELAEAALCDDIGDWMRTRVKTLSADPRPSARQQLGMLLQADPASCRRLARELLERLAEDEVARLAALPCRRAWWQSRPDLEASCQAASEQDIPVCLDMPSLQDQPEVFYQRLGEFCAKVT